jgi:hypothetical protein
MEPLYVAVDDITAAATRHDRSDETVLFAAHEPLFSTGAVVHHGDLYLYSSDWPDIRLARVPLERHRERAAYRFWTGSGWSADVHTAVNLDLGPTGGGLGGFTVTWNPFLGRFLMVHSEPFGSDVMLRSALRPEGPWSRPTRVDVPDAAPDAPFGNYGAREHVQHRSPDGQTIVVTYSHPTGGSFGDIPVVSITLQRDP